MANLTIIFGILALIFLVAALASGLVERAPISFPMIFLGLLIGEHGLGLIKVGLHDPVLETVATLSLAFVFFLDAVNLHFENIRHHWIVPVMALGPGTLLTMALISSATLLVLRFLLLQSLFVGAVLSSVDPVLLRDVARDERVPRSIRESLTTEAGANDMIVLPIVLLLQAIALNQGGKMMGWLLFLARLFLLGPIAGFVVGAMAAYGMRWVRARTPIRREYRALYGIGWCSRHTLSAPSWGAVVFWPCFLPGWLRRCSITIYATAF